jgi:hypothetical protein
MHYWGYVFEQMWNEDQHRKHLKSARETTDANCSTAAQTGLVLTVL